METKFEHKKIICEGERMQHTNDDNHEKEKKGVALETIITLIFSI